MKMLVCSRRFVAIWMLAAAAAVSIFSIILLHLPKTESSDIITANERQWLREHQSQLYFAPDPSYAPYEFYNPEKKRTEGLAFDYIRLIEKKLGVTFKTIQYESFDEIVKAAKDGTISIVNAVTPTAARSEFLLFTNSYVQIANVIIVRKNYPSVLSMNELEGKNVAITSKYAVSEYLQKNYPKISYTIVQTNEQALLDVSTGLSDAAVMDIAAASFFIEKTGIVNLKITGDVYYPVRLSVGSRKDMPELNTIINKALASVSEEEHDRIKRRWIRIESDDFLQSRLFWSIILSVIVLFSAAGFAVTAWNLLLKRQVQERTLKLNDALEKLKNANDEIQDQNQELEEQNGELENMNKDLALSFSQLNLSRDDLQRSIREKETLIRELYHRTKNNMQVIRSMIKLQTLKAKEDDSVHQLVRSVDSRIQAMSLVHGMLCSSGDLSRISIREYIERLSSQILQSFAVSTKDLSLTLNIEDHQLIFDTAIPLGLIVNELMTNTLKYAFPGGSAGSISIHYSHTDSSVIMIYRDNGIGLSPGFDFKASSGIGMDLVINLCEKQMHGKMSWVSSEGLEFRIEFPLTLYIERV